MYRSLGGKLFVKLLFKYKYQVDIKSIDFQR
jgi:hypothetical protein